MNAPLPPVFLLVGGFVLLGLILHDAFEVMMLPRRVVRRMRLMRLFFDASWAVWSGLARRLPATQREHLLGVYGPLSMVMLFLIWAGGLILGFAMMFAYFERHTGLDLGAQLYMSGVTFFTLGYGDLVPLTRAARSLAVAEAGTGLGFLAVVIGYLPVLYQLFARREAHVIQLDGRAGSPPTAAEMLRRHAGPGLQKLDELLREWEVWGSELLESHLSYPMLVYYRSQHANQSWLAAIVAVMDVCALILVGVEDLPPLQARMTFTMARLVVVEMARSFSIAPSRYTGGDRLDAAAYATLIERLGQAGVPWAETANGRETLAALRATYEPLIDGLATYLCLALPEWMPQGGTDHWEGGPRGLIAGRLIEQLSERGPGTGADQRRRRGWLRRQRR